MWGRSMEARRSFYLNSDHDDHAELTAKADRSNVIAIPYVTPANDNVPTSLKLAFQRLLQMPVPLRRRKAQQPCHLRHSNNCVPAKRAA
jgi:hypothetical protein